MPSDSQEWKQRVGLEKASTGAMPWSLLPLLLIPVKGKAPLFRKVVSVSFWTRVLSFIWRTHS